MMDDVLGAPLAPPPPPSPSLLSPAAASSEASELTRNIHKSVRLKSWSAKATDGSEKRGWLHKKLPGKNKFISCWFELDEPNEVRSLHAFIDLSLLFARETVAVIAGSA